MSQEHDQPSPDEAVVENGIHPEAAPFEPGYQPDSLPKISVPDLPSDAQGLSAEALAQVPTLTDLVDDAPGKELVDEDQPAPITPKAEPETAPTEPEPVEIQDEPTQADTWTEELHVRMGKLTDDIHTLNARLDRLEERNKTKA
jgi:hypothetical protein